MKTIVVTTEFEIDFNEDTKQYFDADTAEKALQVLEQRKETTYHSDFVDEMINITHHIRKLTLHIEDNL